MNLDRLRWWIQLWKPESGMWGWDTKLWKKRSRKKMIDQGTKVSVGVGMEERRLSSVRAPYECTTRFQKPSIHLHIWTCVWSPRECKCRVRNLFFFLISFLMFSLKNLKFYDFSIYNFIILLEHSVNPRYIMIKSTF